MNDFLLLVDDDLQYLWDVIEMSQTVFHPTIAPDGKFDYKAFFQLKRKKDFVLFIDRNVLSLLLNFCENGFLSNEIYMQLIGALMAWSSTNDMTISAGYAEMERGTQAEDENLALIELKKFLDVFENYNSQLWLDVARGVVTSIPKITYSGGIPENITVNYSIGNDHYYMAKASLLHIVKLYRNKNITPVNKMIDFLNWTFDNILLCQYLIVYAAMLFTNQESIKPPKNVNSDDITKIIRGCENQAWDISYLSTWSTFYTDTERYKEEFFFATNDILLKRIFINTHGPDGVNGLLNATFSNRDYERIINLLENRQLNRVKPNFGDKSQVYFDSLIENEILNIKKIMNDYE